MESKNENLVKDINDVRKDVDIKFGSKNLLNFGGMSSGEVVIDNDAKPPIKKYVDDKFSEIFNHQEQARKDMQLHLTKIDSMLAEKVDMQALEDTHDKYSVLLEKFMNNCQKKFTDKQEAKKNFKLFER